MHFTSEFKTLNYIIKKPVITEKSMALAKEGKFTFLVNKISKKSTVKKAVEELFKVDVIKFWLFKDRGKKKRVGRLKRKIVKGPDFKKAIVKLKKDQGIDLFELEGKKKK